MTTDVPIDTFGRWQNHTERRLIAQERQPRIYHAYDLLGPGFGATATELLDWNQEEATFNGFFWSQIDALNSPDTSHEWLGIAVVEDDNQRGIQVAWMADAGDPPAVYLRRFENFDAPSPLFTPWRAWAAGGGGGTGTSNVVTGIQTDPSAVSITSTLAGPGTSDTEVDHGIAIGDEALVEAPAEYGIAIGWGTDVRNYAGMALGRGADAVNQADIVIGLGTASKGYLGTDSNYTAGHIAIGTGSRAGNTEVNQESCIAIGNGAQATGQGSIDIGENNLLSLTGEFAVAAGHTAHARGDGEVALGHGAGADYMTVGPPDYGAVNGSTISIGDQANATGARSVAIGNNALCSTDSLPLDPLRGTPIGPVNDAIAIGTSAQAHAQSAIGIGWKAQASGPNSIAIGCGDALNDMMAHGDWAIAMGYRANAPGNQSVAIGPESEANTSDGSSATALGYRAAAYANGSVTVGSDARAHQEGGTSIGGATTAFGLYSTVLGNFAVAEDDYCLAVGANTDAAGAGSVTIGTDNAGNGAQATNPNDFVLGTALHHIQIPGRLNVARRTPTSSADTQGAVGDIASDDNYLYAKTSGGWKRAALSTF